MGRVTFNMKTEYHPTKEEAARLHKVNKLKAREFYNKVNNTKLGKFHEPGLDEGRSAAEQHAETILDLNR